MDKLIRTIATRRTKRGRFQLKHFSETPRYVVLRDKRRGEEHGLILFNSNKLAEAKKVFEAA